MKKLKYFSGIKPTLEDIEFDQTGKENAILDRQREMFTNGVLSGLQLIEEDGVFTLQPGVGYIGGERIEITEAQEVDINPTDEPQYLLLKHQPELSHPVDHFVTGETHNIYQTDGFQIELREMDATGENELLIAEVSTAGILDRRSFIRLSVDDRAGRHAAIHLDGKASASELIGHGQDLQCAALGGGVVEEIIGPDVIRVFGPEGDVSGLLLAFAPASTR